MPDSARPVEGQLYKELWVANHRFELRYGYYEDNEREFCPPVVIFPDFSESPLYTQEGYPLVTQVQDPCPYYTVSNSMDHWCGDCLHYEAEQREIGICRCEHRKKQTLTGGK